MDIRKLLRQDSLVTQDGCYMMDNSAKGLDGSMYYKTAKKPTDEFSAKDLMNKDIDYVLLIWSDFADSHSVDHVILKDRSI